jgi:hypothetical protein
MVTALWTELPANQVSISRRGTNFSILRTVATVYGVHQASYALGKEDFFPLGISTGTWDRSIAFLHLVQRSECVEPNLRLGIRIYLPLIKQDKFAFTLVPSCSKGHAVPFCAWLNAEAVCSGKLGWPLRLGWRAMLVQRLPMGWAVRVSNPAADWPFLARPFWPWGPSSLLYYGHQVFLGSKAAGAWCWPPNPPPHHPTPPSSAEVAKGLELCLLLPAVPA